MDFSVIACFVAEKPLDENEKNDFLFLFFKNIYAFFCDGPFRCWETVEKEMKVINNQPSTHMDFSAKACLIAEKQ